MHDGVEIPSFGSFMLQYIVLVMFALTGFASILDLSWTSAYLQLDWALLRFQVGLIICLIGVSFILYKLMPRVMGFSLVKLIGQLKGEEKTKPFNFWVWAMKMKYIGFLIGLVILTALPRWARFEEEIFRQGTVDWRDAVIRSLLFGFMHMLIGVPVSGAVILTIVGLFFSQLYFVGGVDLSSQAHFQYNLIIFTVLLAYLTFESIAKRRKENNEEKRALRQRH